MNRSMTLKELVATIPDALWVDLEQELALARQQIADRKTALGDPNPSTMTHADLMDWYANPQDFPDPPKPSR